jgi:xylulokinase
MAYLLGIDVGTTGSKALLINEAGAVVANATTEYPMLTPRPLWAEQNPADWWAATVTSIRRVLEKANADAAEVAAVGLTGQMHGLVLLDAQGNVLRPCIMWNDQRTAAECAAITETVGREKVLQLTGNPVLPGFTAPKVLWVRQHEPGVYGRIATILLPKDYVRYRLTHGFFSEVSDASGTSLFDVGCRGWSDEMLHALDIPRAWLPEVTESPVASATVSSRAARETGLLAGTPVVGGGGDQAAQAVGTGIVVEGVVSATLGTSGVVFAASDTYRLEPEGKLHAFCHAVPDKWHLMGVVLSAAGSLQWYRDTFAPNTPFDELVSEAETVPAGSEGLLYLPYLTGERTPHADPHARGAWVGLTVRHSRAHLTRSVLEGVAFALKDSFTLISQAGLGQVEQVRVSGGGARSSLWRQIMADVLAAPLATVNTTEGAAYGAALLAGVGAGLFADIAAACKTSVQVIGQTMPGMNAAIYADYYPRYQALYPALAEEFRALSRTVNRQLTAG